MGKSGKTKAAKSGSKAEAKAAKKAKAASKAERRENKKAKDVTAESSSKASKGKGKGKAKQKEVDDDEDLIQTLEEYRRRWEEGKVQILRLLVMHLTDNSLYMPSAPCLCISMTAI